MSATLSMASLKAMESDPRTHKARSAVLAARKLAAATRAAVDVYEAPIFARFSFVNRWTGKPVTRVQDLYLSEQEELCEELYAAFDVAHREHGYHDLRTGQCPALTAEHAVTKAETAMLKLAEEFTGVEFADTFGELREKALALFLNPPTSRRRRS